MRTIKAEDLLAERYGEKGSESREKFRKAKAGLGTRAGLRVGGEGRSRNCWMERV